MLKKMTALRFAATPVYLGVLVALTACGGGGGDSVAGAGGPTPASAQSSGGGGDPFASAGTPTPASAQSGSGQGASTPPETSGGTGTPPEGTPQASEVRYSLGESSVVKDNSTDYAPHLQGMLATSDGGYRVIWGRFLGRDESGAALWQYFERRYDAVGQSLGPETPIDQPEEDLSGSRTGVAAALGGGEVRFVQEAGPGVYSTVLYAQHFSADGVPLDDRISVTSAFRDGHAIAAVALQDGTVALSWQTLRSPGSLMTAVLRPSPR